MTTSSEQPLQTQPENDADQAPERFVTFGGVSLALELSTPMADQASEFVLASVVDSLIEVNEHAKTRLVQSDDGDETEVWREGKRVYRAKTVVRLADLLMGEVVFQLANVGSAGLMLHAGLLARDGRAVLIPGKSGQGKSTLSSWLLGSGYDFLTDELAFVAAGGTVIEGFARPIRLRAKSIPVLEERFGSRLHGEDVWESHGNLLLPPAALRQSDSSEPAEIGVVLFAHYDTGGDGILRRVSGVEAGSGLMQSLINARNLEDHGFREVVRLARTVPAYEIRYSNCEQVEAALDPWPE